LSSSSRLGGRRLARLAALAVGIALGAPEARALSVHAVYRTACSREIGVILKVEKREIHMLRLDGSLARIPRHEIVSLLYYPLSQLPLSHVPTPRGFPPLRVKTRFGDQVVDLLTGWPIDYSENQVSFLLRNGKELVVDRDSIWSLAYDSSSEAAAPARAGSQPIAFVHPQTSGFCSEKGAAAGARPIFAQQILNDQIVIRRELDRLLEGYEQVVEYEQDQKFYPGPFLYRNRTMLGLWVSLFSRYGASTTRSNNFTPLLVDELALGPFRYQHEFLSGAAPNDMFLHHEAQSQIFYRFKAAYFHTSVFFDPNLLLVGTKYPWREPDLEGETLDDRVSETLGIEFGFDWGPLALELYPAVLGQSAVKIGDFFDAVSEHNLWRAGARFTFAAGRVQLAAGGTSTESSLDVSLPDPGPDEPSFVFYSTRWSYRYARLNLGWQPNARLDLALSGIVRDLEYSADSNVVGVQSHVYEGLSISSSLEGSYQLSHRFSVGGHVILEMQRREGTDIESRSRLLPRLGLFTGFWF
jgi:hypothetical protein